MVAEASLGLVSPSHDLPHRPPPRLPVPDNGNKNNFIFWSTFVMILPSAVRNPQVTPLHVIGVAAVMHQIIL